MQSDDDGDQRSAEPSPTAVESQPLEEQELPSSPDIRPRSLHRPSTSAPVNNNSDDGGDEPDSDTNENHVPTLLERRQRLRALAEKRREEMAAASQEDQKSKKVDSSPLKSQSPSVTVDSPKKIDKIAPDAAEKDKATVESESDSDDEAAHETIPADELKDLMNDLENSADEDSSPSDGEKPAGDQKGSQRPARHRKLSKKAQKEMRMETERLFRSTLVQLEPEVQKRDMGAFLNRFIGGNQTKPIPVAESSQEPAKQIADNDSTLKPLLKTKERFARPMPTANALKLAVNLDLSDSDLELEDGDKKPSENDPNKNTSTFVAALMKSKKGKGIAEQLMLAKQRQQAEQLKKASENAQKPKNMKTGEWLKFAAAEAKKREALKRQKALMKHELPMEELQEPQPDVPMDTEGKEQEESAVKKDESGENVHELKGTEENAQAATDVQQQQPEEEEDEAEFTDGSDSSSDDNNAEDQDDDEDEDENEENESSMIVVELPKEEDEDEPMQAALRPKKNAKKMSMDSDDENDMKMDIETSKPEETSNISWTSQFMPTCAPAKVSPKSAVQPNPLLAMLAKMKSEKQVEKETSAPLPPPPPPLGQLTALDEQDVPLSQNDGGNNGEDEDIAFQTLKFKFDNVYDIVEESGILFDQAPQEITADANNRLNTNPSPFEQISATQADRLQQYSERIMEISQESSETRIFPWSAGNAAAGNQEEPVSLMDAVRKEIAIFKSEETVKKEMLLKSSETSKNNGTNDNNNDDDDEDDGKPKLRRLIKTAELDDSEDEENGEEEENGASTSGAFSLIQKVENTVQKPFDQKPTMKTNFVDDEAEVEEDEFMNLGGMDGENLEAEKALREELAAFIDEDEDTLAKMTLAEMEQRLKQDETVVQYFNEQMRAKDLKDTKELVKDIATGKILDKRKHNQQITRVERDKFGRAEEEEDDGSNELRELDDAEDYGVFGDIITKYISIRREAHRRNMLRKRRRFQEQQEEEEARQRVAAMFAENGLDEDGDWTNEFGQGSIQIAPGEVIETDLDKLEERARKRKLLRELEVENTNDSTGSGVFEDDENSQQILNLVRDRSKSTNQSNKRTKVFGKSTSFSANVVSVFDADDGTEPARPMLPLLSKPTAIYGSNSNSSNSSSHDSILKNQSSSAIAKLKASMGITDDEMKKLKLGHEIKKGKSGFAHKEIGRKASAFNVGMNNPTPAKLREEFSIQSAAFVGPSPSEKSSSKPAVKRSSSLMLTGLAAGKGFSSK